MKTILFITKAILLFFITSGQAQQTYEIMWSMSTTPAQATITIEVGDTVKWIWAENGMPHDVSSIDPNAPDGFGSTMMTAIGSIYEFTFNEEVTFDYRCSIHPGSMFGTITVEASQVEEIVTIPDANFKTYLLNSPSINLNGDSEIQLSEALAFTGSIDCSNLSIADLTGIEAFTGINSLFCNNNMLTSLNIDTNTELVLLACSGNELEVLNLSNNILLTDLFCDDNMLMTLDVSNNPVLSYLKCDNNDLSSLDMSNNVSLVDLYCSNTHITSLDLSNNPALIALDCSNNHLLTSLDVKNGNNISIAYFNALENDELTCIEVDDADYSSTNWPLIDDTAFFSEDCAMASVGELVTGNKFVVYPNPAQDRVTIESSSSVHTYKIFDLQGKQLSERIFDSNNSTINIDISSFESGIYFIEVSFVNQEALTFKIVKN